MVLFIQQLLTDYSMVFFRSCYLTLFYPSAVAHVIKDSGTGSIGYMSPEAKDVPALMRNVVAWIRENEDLPCPVVAAIAHYQFVTIHPYYDGNGRTARLLTTLLLYLGGYDLKGLYSLEEYYARNLHAYYMAMTVGPTLITILGAQKRILPGGLSTFVKVWLIRLKKLWVRWQQLSVKESLHSYTITLSSSSGTYALSNAFTKRTD